VLLDLAKHAWRTRQSLVPSWPWFVNVTDFGSDDFGHLMNALAGRGEQFVRIFINSSALEPSTTAPRRAVARRRLRHEGPPYYLSKL